MPKASAPSPATTRIRKASFADLPAVTRIEREQFSNPWNREYFGAELANSISQFFVAEAPEAGVLIGYLLFWRLVDELELHKIAIAADWQRRGHASRLLDFFIRSGRSWGSRRALLEVRSSNIPAIRLYEKFAFRLVGRRRDYYNGPVEDALVYEFVF